MNACVTYEYEYEHECICHIRIWMNMSHMNMNACHICHVWIWMYMSHRNMNINAYVISEYERLLGIFTAVGGGVVARTSCHIKNMDVCHIET